MGRTNVLLESAVQVAFLALALHTLAGAYDVDARAALQNAHWPTVAFASTALAALHIIAGPLVLYVVNLVMLGITMLAMVSTAIYVSGPEWAQKQIAEVVLSVWKSIAKRVGG